MAGIGRMTSAYNPERVYFLQTREENPMITMVIDLLFLFLLL